MPETPILDQNDPDSQPHAIDAQDTKSPVDLSHESQEHSIELTAYVSDYMANPYTSSLAEEPLKAARYSNILCDFAASRFNLDVLMGERSSGSRHNPVLNELGGMLVSLDHNVGVYYSEDDIPSLFTTIANRVLDNPDVQEGLASRNVSDFDSAFAASTEQTFSLNRKVALAVTQDEQGEWRVVDHQDFVGDQDFKPLEVIRQNSGDKAGQKKYRFRMPTYTRQHDDIHSEPLSEGWFTSEWVDEPNYWSEQLRTMLVQSLITAEAQLQDDSIGLTLLTEGGIFKGTATANTDLDTLCLVTANAVDDFEKVHEALRTTFPDEIAKLPFDVKKGDAIATYFIDRNSGMMYFHNDISGGFKEVTWDDLFNGSYVFRVRDYEKGTGVTTSKGFQIFKKSTPAVKDSSVLVALDLANDTIVELDEQGVAGYNTNRESLKQRRRERDAHIVEDEYVS